MNIKPKLGLAILCLVLCNSLFLQAQINPPVAVQKEFINVLHGDTTVDYFHWMRDKNDVDFINYLYSENAYADRKMKSSELLRKKLYEEFRSYMRETQATEPLKKDNYYYYVRFIKDKEYEIYCRKKDSLTAPEEIYLDLNKLAEEYQYAAMQILKISPDHKIVAYALNTSGGDAGNLYIKNLESGIMYTEEIEDVAAFEWTGNNKTFYYQLEDKKTKKANKILRHTLGDPVEQDTLIYSEKDINLGAGLSKTGKYLLLERSSFVANEILFLNEENPYGLFERFEPIQNNVQYSLTHYKQEDYFYIQTNWNAPNGKFMRAPIKTTPKTKWEEIIPARDSVILSGVVVKRNHYILTERKHGDSYLRIMDRKTNKSTIIKPNLAVYEQGLSHVFDYDTTYFRYGYSSLMQPYKLFTHDLISGKDSVYIDTLAQKYNIDPNNYITERLWANTKDGQKVPMDVVYKKGVQLNGNNPVYMYAYGCYGMNMTANFNYSLKSILDRGFIYVLAHPRGESFLGNYWHDQGKLLNKKNTFTDIIACCEYLIDKNYTQKGRISIRGGSAGGLLVGSVVTMRPDLFGVGVAEVPFVDVLNEMQDTIWPNIIAHFTELGNPFNKLQYDVFKSYCPYQNTKEAAYPNLLVTSGYSDSRVPVWSPAKWVAKLRLNKRDSTDLLFKTVMEGGHGGASGRYAGLKEEAFTMAYIMKCLGIEENYIEVRGKVVDKFNIPIPFVSVFLKGTTYGTSTNYDGEFLLELNAGQPQQIVFQAIGFSTKVVDMDLNTRTSDLQIAMESEDQYIHQVVITSDGKDPAYGIIKNAQDKRKFHKDQLNSFSTDIYMKNSVRLNEIPKKIPKIFKNANMPDSTDIGLVYLSESVARYHYQAPDNYKEEMIASKSAGMQQGYSWNRASDVLMNFYNNLIDLRGYSEKGFVSPIASTSLIYYKFKLKETFKDQDQLVHKIEVIPRRKSDPVFKGYIYIYDKLWSIHSLNLSIGKESQIEWVDSVNIKQSFVPVSDSIYMPLSMEITDHIKVFNFGATSKNLGFFSNYRINRNFNDDFFQNEVFKVEKGANKKNPVFWEDTRPALLSLEENKTYHKSDSMLVITESKEYRDSVNHERNKVTFGKIALTGYNYRNHFKNRNWGFNSIISMVDFNTVEGWSLNFEPHFSRRADSLSMPWYQKWYGDAKFRYSVNNNQFYAYVNGTYNIDYIHYQRIKFSAGQMTEQYNQTAMSPLVNSMYSLFYLENYAKFYEKTFIKMSYGLFLNTYFDFNVGFEYQYRRALTNTTDFSFVEMDEKAYTSNNPQMPYDDALAFETNNALAFNAELKFFFKRKYASYPDLRQYYPSDKPVITLRYKKGVPGLGSIVNYDYAEIEVADKIDLNNMGTSQYKILFGGFLNTDSMYFMDYKHFNGNQTIFLRSQGLSAFNSLEYYDYSTNKAFFEVHYEHHFNGGFINKIPLLRKLKAQSLFGVNFLYTEDKKDFTELFIGFENIFNVFRIDFVGRYRQEDKFSPQFRIGMDLAF